MGAGREDPSATGRPRAVELIGPPGGGKSTVRLALSENPGSVLSLSIYWRPWRTPLFVRSALSLAPTTLRQSMTTPLTSKEHDWMVRLQASTGLLERASSKGIPVVVFDQGPLFTMVRLRGALHEAAWSERFRRWWEHTVETWAFSLDLLVVVDAPDDVLLERIRTRSKPHALKNETEVRAREILAHDRRLYESVIAEIRGCRGVSVLRFDTSREPVDRIAAQTMTQLGRTASTTVSGGALRAR